MLESYCRHATMRDNPSGSIICRHNAVDRRLVARVFFALQIPSTQPTFFWSDELPNREMASRLRAQNYPRRADIPPQRDLDPVWYPRHPVGSPRALRVVGWN